MKYFLGVLGILILLITGTSCRDDFSFEPSTGNLEFSQDTVFLDTVFSTIGSSTRTLKVYNRSSDNIVIPRVALADGTNSKYRLNVDGIPGQVFENVELLAKDSLFVFIETTVDITDFTNDTQFVYEDQIEFDSGALQQKVELVTLIQDAIFLFPERDADGVIGTLPLGTTQDGEEIRIQGFVLDDSQLNFTNEKPYVIYGYAAIPNNRTMTIQPGARLHFHANSGIIATNEATVKALGDFSSTEDLENEIIIEGDRLEPSFADLPGQWGTIWLTQGSLNHEFNHVTIKNASVGILMDNSNPNSTGATLKINNSQILNSSNSALIATTADVDCSNSIFHNSGQSTVIARLGGSYNFNNCTISNYWRNSFRQDATLLITNGFPNSELSEDLIEATFSNCIVYGDRNIEIALADTENSLFNFNFNHSLLRINDVFNDLDGNPNYDFNNPLLYENNILNIDPEFENPARFLMRIDNSSGANGIANPTTASNTDILNITRGSNPDAGAYESQDLNN